MFVLEDMQEEITSYIETKLQDSTEELTKQIERTLEELVEKLQLTKIQSKLMIDEFEDNFDIELQWSAIDRRLTS
jgi:hypothetical protein